MVYTHLPAHKTHYNIQYARRILCLPVNMCARPVTAIGSVRRLIFRSCPHDGSSNEDVNDHGPVYNDTKYWQCFCQRLLGSYEVEECSAMYFQMLRSENHLRSADVELQQRAVEYIQLSNVASIDVLVCITRCMIVSSAVLDFRRNSQVFFCH